MGLQDREYMHRREEAPPIKSAPQAEVHPERYIPPVKMRVEDYRRIQRERNPSWRQRHWRSLAALSVLVLILGLAVLANVH